MIESLRGRLGLSAAIAFIGLIWVMPNFVNTESIWWPTQEKLNYGLDIQGGLHLGLGVDIPRAMEEQSIKLSNQIKEDLKDDYTLNVDVDIVDAQRVLLNIRPQTAGGPGSTQIAEYLETYHGNSLQVTTSSIASTEVQYYDNYLKLFKKGLIDKAREILMNRVDQFGVAEPSITLQGEDRIIVQLPGIKDTESAKDVLNRTAKLEFMMVDKDVAPEQLQNWITEGEAAANIKLGGEGGLKYLEYVEALNKALKDKLPKNRFIRFEKNPAVSSIEEGKIPHLLRVDAMMGGSSLEDANTSFNPSTGRPVVVFRFDGKGATAFGNLTSKNVGEQMAIVLDGVVKSAPNINEPIMGGSGEITLGSGSRDEALSEANLLSLVLKSGALPVRLELMEERTVGPSLGQDSIEKGRRATLVGLILVLIFMVVYYRVFGVIADIALFVNIILLFAVLSSLKATLTLPGIAGIALTVGMAVDANIIIFERVKEEIRKGASLAASVRDGFNAAFWTIFDSNITTILTCMVLMYFGTGPIRGFAVTLTVGLVVSMFTAIFVSRTLLELVIVKLKMKVQL